jgi:hypothetical protein
MHEARICCRSYRAYSHHLALPVAHEEPAQRFALQRDYLIDIETHIFTCLSNRSNSPSIRATLAANASRNAGATLAISAYRSSAADSIIRYRYSSVNTPVWGDHVGILRGVERALLGWSALTHMCVQGDLCYVVIAGESIYVSDKTWEAIHRGILRSIYGPAGEDRSVIANPAQTGPEPAVVDDSAA